MTKNFQDNFKYNNMPQVNYEYFGDEPKDGDIIVNRDENFIPITHKLSDGVAAKWVKWETDDDLKGRASIYGLLEKE